MAQLLKLQRLSSFDSRAILAPETRGPDIYEIPLHIEGNSLLSSLAVSAIDPGASVLVEYYDEPFGNATGSEYPLGGHSPATTVTISRETITRIHQAPILRVTVSGGSATFGVYVTVVSSFATDLDAALVTENQPVNILTDKAIPLAGYDPSDAAWHFVKVVDGVLQVSSSDEVLNKRFYNESVGLAPGATYINHISYVVPVGRQFRWLGGFGSSDNWAIWRVKVDGNIYLVRRNDIDSPNVDLALSRGLTLAEGETLTVEVRNRNPYGDTGDLETGIYGIEENA